MLPYRQRHVSTRIYAERIHWQYHIHTATAHAVCMHKQKHSGSSNNNNSNSIHVLIQPFKDFHCVNIATINESHSRDTLNRITGNMSDTRFLSLLVSNSLMHTSFFVCYFQNAPFKKHCILLINMCLQIFLRICDCRETIAELFCSQ